MDRILPEEMTVMLAYPSPTGKASRLSAHIMSVLPGVIYAIVFFEVKLIAEDVRPPFIEGLIYIG